MSAQFNAVRGALTAGGTGNVTLSSTAAGKGQSPSVIPVGWSGGIRFDAPDGTTWELTKCTMLAGLVLQRDTVVAGSSGPGVKVNLPVGTTALQTALADDFAVPSDVAFSTSIPLTNTAGVYMPQQAVAGALAFTPAANAVRGAMAYLRLVADGVNAPTYPAFKEWGGSLGYDNRNGIENQMQFFFDGYNYFVSISQAVGAVPAPAAASGVSLTGPTSGVVSTASTTFTVGVTPVGGTIAGTVVVTPSSGGAGGTFSPTSVSLSSGTTSATFTYTPASTGAKTISVTNNGGLTSPSAITYTVAASATSPAQMAAPVATTGDTTASVALTAPSNGGSAITGYTVTSSPAGMVDSNAGSTSLTHVMTGGTNGTAYTFTATATNAIGTSTASPASNSVTLQSFVRATGLVSTVESGTGPYTYTGTGGTFDTAIGGILSKSLASGQDGSMDIVISGTDAMFAINASTTKAGYTSLAYYVWGFQNKLSVKAGGTAGTDMTVTNGAVIRYRRTGSVLTVEVSVDNRATWVTRVTYTGCPTGALYFQILPQGTAVMSNPTAIGLV